MGFGPGLTQIGIYSHRSRLEAWNFGLKRKMHCTICVAKTKTSLFLHWFSGTAVHIVVWFFRNVNEQLNKIRVTTIIKK